MAASDDDNEFSYSFQTDNEYKGPCIANEPRASPVEVDQVPTAHPVSSSLLSSGLSYPVAQPLVSANRVTKKPPEASRSLVLRSHHVVSGSSSERLDVAEEANSSVDLPLSSVELREVTLDDCSSGVEVEVDGGNGNRGRLVVPSHGSESDESSYMSEEEDSVAAARPRAERPRAERPRAERRGKRGSCYRCLMGNRFTQKEVCIVCDAKYCCSCVRRAMGAMPEGRKCLTCIGLRISESNRESLGKCSRMLKRLLSDSELRQIMRDEVNCKANQLYSRLIYVNGWPLSEEELDKLRTCPYPPKKLKPGEYWYDKVSGYWGKIGEKPCQIISPHMKIGASAIIEQASNGDTDIFINDREITKAELMMLKMVGVQCERKPRFWVDSDGSYQEEGYNRIMGNIWNKKRARLACAVLSLPIPPTSSSAGEPTDEPTIYNPKMLKKILLIGNEKCGATTIYKQARSLYEVPFTKDERERIKVIIQTNLYAYLAMVLEAHEEEMNNNLSSDQTGNTGDETASFISPRLKHFSDWLVREKEEGNLKIFPASSRQTVADLWRVPAIQDTYKRLRETLPRNAAYFLGRILEILRSEYEPSDMDILKAEGLSSMEGTSCVEFSFPSTTQKGSLEDHNYHDKYQLIRLNPRSLGKNWKLLELFEDAELVIFCVSLTDYGEYVEDVDGVLVNKMIANKQLFESMVTHPTLANKRFLLALTKFDLLEEKIVEVPLRTCEWFEDFNPLISQNQTSEHNPLMAQCAFHYIVFQFKRLYDSLRMRRRKFKPKLFVSQVSLEGDSVDNALRYARKILSRHVEKHQFSNDLYY